MRRTGQAAVLRARARLRESIGNGAGKRIPRNTYIQFSCTIRPTVSPKRIGCVSVSVHSKAPITHEILNSLGFIGPSTYIVEGKELLTDEPEQTDTRDERSSLPNIPAVRRQLEARERPPVSEPVTIYGLTPHLHLRGKSMNSS